MIGCLVALTVAIAAPVPENKDEKAALDALREAWVATTICDLPPLF